MYDEAKLNELEAKISAQLDASKEEQKTGPVSALRWLDVVETMCQLVRMQIECGEPAIARRGVELIGHGAATVLETAHFAPLGVKPTGEQRTLREQDDCDCGVCVLRRAIENRQSAGDPRVVEIRARNAEEAMQKLGRLFDLDVATVPTPKANA